MPDHDPLLKELLRTFFSGFLALVAPQLQPLSCQFLDKELAFTGQRRGRREADLVVRLLLAGGEILLVHVEIEAEFRAAMGRRLWSYYLLLQARLGEPTISVLINLRGGPPGLTLQTFEETVGGQPRLFGYTVLGIGRYPAGELLARPEPIAWAFAALTLPQKGQRPALKLACLARVTAASRKLSDLESFLLVNCIETYLELSLEETVRYEELRALSSAKEATAVNAVKMTWADRMKSEGRQELLLTVLEQRFGKLPAIARQRLAEIRSADLLNQLARRVLVAGSLAELGLE
jgi:hypothetical protein